MKSIEQHVDALEQSTTTTTNSKKHKSKNPKLNFLEAFKRLTHSEKLQRINEAVNLLQHLKEIEKTDDDDDQVCTVRRNCVVIFIY